MDDFKTIDISKEDMAKYLESIFNSDRFKNLIGEQSSICFADSIYQNLGHLFQTYLCATGDNSQETVDEIIDDFSKNQNIINGAGDSKNKLSGMDLFFGEYVMPKIIDAHAKKLNISNVEDIESLITIQEAIYKQTHSNLFLSHSFNGVLLNDIKNNGLNINNEMFQSEYAAFEQIGMRQPYKKGELCFCELSKASFGYAQGPERLSMTLGVPYRREEEEESLSINDYYLKKFSETLDKKYSPDDKYRAVAFETGKRMIDFYFGEKPTCVIAIMKKDHKNNNMQCNISKNFLNAFVLCSSYKAQWDNELKAKRPEYESCTNSNVATYINTHLEKYPNEAGTLKKALIRNITQSCLSHFARNGNADGYGIEGGKVPANELAFCAFENPRETFSQKLVIKQRISSVKSSFALMNPENIPPFKPQEIDKKILKFDIVAYNSMQEKRLR